MSARYYGKPLTATVKDGRLVIEIGVQTLAHATAFAEWANPWRDDDSEHGGDYLRDFAIVDAPQFASDVVHAMLAEREDGSTPLSDFLDAMSQAAIEDGSIGLHEDFDHRIKHGTTSPLEASWSTPEEG
jgi:hypothetical protein